MKMFLAAEQDVLRTRWYNLSIVTLPTARETVWESVAPLSLVLLDQSAFRSVLRYAPHAHPFPLYTAKPFEVQFPLPRHDLDVCRQREREIDWQNINTVHLLSFLIDM